MCVLRSWSQYIGVGMIKVEWSLTYPFNQGLPPLIYSALIMNDGHDINRYFYFGDEFKLL